MGEKNKTTNPNIFQVFSVNLKKILFLPSVCMASLNSSGCPQDRGTNQVIQTQAEAKLRGSRNKNTAHLYSSSLLAFSASSQVSVKNCSWGFMLNRKQYQ